MTDHLNQRVIYILPRPRVFPTQTVSADTSIYDIPIQDVSRDACMCIERRSLLRFPFVSVGR